MRAKVLTRSSVLRKARAILARSKSSNPHEAATAAALLVKLLDKYHLDRGQLVPDDVSELTLDVLPRLVIWRARLATGLAKHLRCHPWASRKTILHPGTRQAMSESVRLMAAGDPTDLQALSYLYAALTREIDAWTKAHCAIVDASEAGEFADSFRRGMVDTIRARLAAEAADRAPEGHAEKRAMVRLTDALARAQNYVARKSPLKPKQDESPAAGSAGGYFAGRLVGERVTLRAEKAIGEEGDQITAHETRGGQP